MDSLGKFLSPEVPVECSWCDGFFAVCQVGAARVEAGDLIRVCDSCRSFLRNPLTFERAILHRSDGGRDVDANGWLSNAIRLLEDAP